MDAETSVAPTLQILLKKLWDQATLESRTPVFDERLYRRHRATLGDFVRTDNQNITNHKSLSSETRHAIEAGLLLDFLECHITPELTSRHQLLRVLLKGDPQATPAIARGIRGRGDMIRELRELCISHYLLVQPDSGTNAEPEASQPSCSTIHSPLMCMQFTKRLMRPVLELDEFWNSERRNPARAFTASVEPSSLRAIERGRPGMRAWTPLEESRSRRTTQSTDSPSVDRRHCGFAAGRIFLDATRMVSAGSDYGLSADADQVKTLYDLAEESPWVSTRLAHGYFEDERSLRRVPTTASSTGPAAASGVVSTTDDSVQTETALTDGLRKFEDRDRRRRGLRAALVLVHLKCAEARHVERLLQECLTFTNITQSSQCRMA